MATTVTPLQDLVLTPQQQDLLFAALNSNRQAGAAGTTPPGSNNPSGSKSGNNQTVTNDTSFLDYDYSFDGADSSFDFSFDNGASSTPGDGLTGTGATSSSDGSPAADNESADKRGHPDDEDDEENEPKRREGAEKVPKKPGRKPLTSEPSSKRKAQNRAAQRAFRERKERHLKDLETKVAELEKASEDANNENSALRAKVDKITVELNEYKKKVAAMPTPTRAALVSTSHAGSTFGNPMMNNLSDVNFQFEFPKFGQLPGSSKAANGTAASSHQSTRQNSTNSITSPLARSTDAKPSPVDSTHSNGLHAQAKDDLAKFSGIFSPPLTNHNVASVSDNQSHKSNSLFSLTGASTSSPSASSNSNGGPSSSCGTSPEPFTQSPMGFKPIDTLTTIGEEQPIATAKQDLGHFANIDSNDINWLASQNNYQFDPQLFGNYRESQDNVLTNPSFDDTFFNDAFDVDFLTPFNVAPSPVAPKNDLIAQIDAAKDSGLSPDPEVLMNCNKIWERLQGCPKVQSGDFDLDALCSDLQKKAKCTGGGAVIGETDFNHVMKKYLCPDEVAQAKEESEAIRA